jgi:GDP-D-mannose dehydratase
MIAGYQIDVQVNPEFVRENEIKLLRGSNDKLKALVNYQPEIELLDTLKKMYGA